MRHRIFLTLTMLLLIVSATSILQSQVNYPMLQAQDFTQTQAQLEGTKKCHNFTRGGEKANCSCWGNANPNDKKYPNCKQQGEDPKCTNHCKKDMCDCKSPCQS